MADAVDESLAVEVGRRLRERRQSRDETLGHVAASAHISVSHLAEIETGKTTCSLPVLIRLSQSLDFPLSAILPTLGTPRMRIERVGAATSEQRLISEPGLELIVRSISAAPGETVDVGLDDCDALVYVLHGRCQLHIPPRNEEVNLGVGDSASIRRSAHVSVEAVTQLTAVAIIGSRSDSSTADR